MLGRPAQPMAQALSGSIAQMVRGIAGIREAYLPHCFVKEVVEPPAQVLVLVLDAGADRERVLSSVGDGLAQVLPQGILLDVWLLSEGDSLLDTVRGTRMHIHCQPPPERKPWWKFFG